jgi:psp operon transcriptional activator
MERANQFVGSSLAFLDAVERASRAAPLNRPVLVVGERGTGKELIAERLHHLSGRWAGPLVVMNCAALPENLIEAELFGHEAGSFTGAAKTRHGRFEEADGGTLFLDELGTLSMPAQDRFLRAVEYGEITRIGASKPIQVDVRIVAATNESLPDQVDKGKFRADLLDRLSFEVVTLPPLRARTGDIPLLTDHFGRRMGVELEWPNWPGFSPRAVAELEAYNWPGNVRELRNVIERVMILEDSDVITADWLPRGLTGDERTVVSTPVAAVSQPAESATPSFQLPDVGIDLEQVELSLVRQAMERSGGNQTRAAELLGVSRDQLRYRLKKIEDSQPGR